MLSKNCNYQLCLQHFVRKSLKNATGNSVIGKNHHYANALIPIAIIKDAVKIKDDGIISYEKVAQ